MLSLSKVQQKKEIIGFNAVVGDCAEVYWLLLVASHSCTDHGLIVFIISDVALFRFLLVSMRRKFGIYALAKHEISG